jgi:hypothetical protein
VNGLKLLTIGLLAFAGGLALLAFTDLNPAILLVGGPACALIGLANFMSPAYEPGPAVSAGDVSDAANLANL